MLTIPGVNADERMHSHVIQKPLAASRGGIMLHYDDSSSDREALEWFHDPRCRNGYTWLVLDDGRVVELADPGMRTPHAGPCLTPLANSRFYGIAAATNGSVCATARQVSTIVRLCVAVARFHRWVDPLLVGHDEQAVWTAGYTTHRTLWGTVGRKVDPTGRRPDGVPVLDVRAVKHSVILSAAKDPHSEGQPPVCRPACPERSEGSEAKGAQRRTCTRTATTINHWRQKTMIIRNYAIGTLALLLLACATWARYTVGQLAQSRANERALALRASNVEALHDTTHDLARENLQLARLLGHSLHAYEKRVVQVDQGLDRVDSLLGTQHPGIYAMRVGFDSVQATVALANRDSIDQGAMPFHLRQQPFTLDAVVSRQPGGDSTSLAVRIVLDTIPLGVRIECSPPGDAGIRAASVLAMAPAWAAVRFGDVQQNPDVCNSAPPPTTRRRFLSWTPLALSGGWQLGAGRGGWSALIGTALTFGAP